MNKNRPLSNVANIGMHAQNKTKKRMTVRGSSILTYSYKYLYGFY